MVPNSSKNGIDPDVKDLDFGGRGSRPSVGEEKSGSHHYRGTARSRRRTVVGNKERDVRKHLLKK